MELELKYLVPEIIMLITAGVVVLVGLAKKDSKRQWAPIIAVFGLLYAIMANTGIDFTGLTPTFWFGFPSSAEWIPLQSMANNYLNPQYITYLAIGIGILSILAAWDMPFTKEPGVADSKFRGEFFALMLCSITGVSMMGKVNDLILLFIALELVSIPTYVMVATSRSQTLAQEAGVKYFFLGALSAAIYLFGFSYLYGFAGSTRFDDIATAFATRAPDMEYLPAVAIIGLLMVIIGISYKMAAVPLHFYAPDVYQGAATPVTAFLAFAPKAAGLVAIILVLSTTGWTIPGATGSSVTMLLTVIAVLTMTIGNVMALLQRNVKRILAYSSIAHTGYMLVGLVSGPGDRGAALIVHDLKGKIVQSPMSDGVSAALFYLAGYAFMNLGVFAGLIYLQGKADSAEDLDGLAGAAKEHPGAALTMAICLFSLIGLPPTIGFLGKLYIVNSALATGHTWLAIITVINAAIAATYYLRIIAAMYLRDSWAPIIARKSSAPRVAAGICCVAVIIFGIYPMPLTSTMENGKWQSDAPAAVSPAAAPGMPALPGRR